MISSCDVGSLPLRVEESLINKGARKSITLLPFIGVPDEETKTFEREIVNSFADKLRNGIDIPNYTQFRDMNEMFFELIQGIEKVGAEYVAFRNPKVKPNTSIPEVNVVKRNISEIRDLANVEYVRLKACVTGPYTLSSFFSTKSPGLFEDLGSTLTEIFSRSFFETKYSRLDLLCIDEPVLGFLDDPLLDYGSEGRESLRRAWEEMCRVAALKNVETCMHLHDTSDDLFWEVEHLHVVESHVEDPLYTLEKTKGRLEDTDKCLKASIYVTLFDKLIEEKIMAQGKSQDLQQRLGEIWTEIRHRQIDPLTFLEDPALVAKRLEKVVRRFGPERVPYAGPECGLSSWPTYESSMECLKRISATVEDYNKKKH
ncbi:MAG: hypothetical protein JSV18_02795 [Candidatus Bathyarchaeota archaeon]|nr:MAG: hypothetical protein JSV18_02795 [Candidatus Bathyarchaeota archaeon]